LWPDGRGSTSGGQRNISRKDELTTVGETGKRENCKGGEGEVSAKGRKKIGFRLLSVRRGNRRGSPSGVESMRKQNARIVRRRGEDARLRALRGEKDSLKAQHWSSGKKEGKMVYGKEGGGSLPVP